MSVALAIRVGHVEDFGLFGSHRHRQKLMIAMNRVVNGRSKGFARAYFAKNATGLLTEMRASQVIGQNNSLKKDHSDGFNSSESLFLLLCSRILGTPGCPLRTPEAQRSSVGGPPNSLDST